MIETKNITLEYTEIKHETPKAYLLLIGEHEHWIPKSQVKGMDMEARKVELSEWICIQKGLVESPGAIVEADDGGDIPF